MSGPLFPFPSSKATAVECAGASGWHPRLGVPSAEGGAGSLLVGGSLPPPSWGWGTCPGVMPPSWASSRSSKAVQSCPPSQGHLHPPWTGRPAGGVEPGAVGAKCMGDLGLMDALIPCEARPWALEHLAVAPQPPRFCKLLWLQPMGACHLLPTYPQAPTLSSSSNRRDSLGEGSTAKPSSKGCAPGPAQARWGQ